jgi:hypothetical protein
MCPACISSMVQAAAGALAVAGAASSGTAGTFLARSFARIVRVRKTERTESTERTQSKETTRHDHKHNRTTQSHHAR